MTPVEESGDRGRPISPLHARDAAFRSPEGREPLGTPASTRIDTYRPAPLASDSAQRLSPITRYMAESSRKRPLSARAVTDESIPPSLIQRRAETSAKVPRLALDPTVDAPVPRTHALEAHSAPAHQPAFGPEARLPSPSHLFRARERDAGRVPPLSANDLDSSHRSSPTQASAYEANGQTPSAPRFALPHMAMPSPAFHSSHFGASRPRAELGAPDADAEAVSSRLAANRVQFLSLFSDFFDSLSDSRTLKATLEHQIRASNTLLQTLQRSNKVFDEATDRRVRQESQLWESRFARLESRLDRIEARLADLAQHAPPTPEQQEPETSRI
ncbi:hypothetical protein GLX27_003749 [Malassezia furfur]|uniref:Biogenesis of lysosome-related organelles complex 1 subunit CNL1 n=1 Tax=Malassezia furfur TaxID=55194 RepID=A0ABY8EUI8_MALFU|nr:hypothetical protein CBS14141_004125 [Malassezia furfur]WFD49071.1 hypothetical protein GLX27_003749 [Malassezia furfur]